MNPAPAIDLVVRRIEDHLAVQKLMLQDQNYLDTVRAIAGEIVKALRKGNKVLFFGNGGSAADAQHLAAELTGRFLKDRPSLAGMSLTTNTSALTAIGNDYSYDEVFSRPLRGLGVRGDVAVGITTSGDSGNVLKAMQAARELGILRVGLTGGTGGKLRHAVDYCLCAPAKDTPRIQETHILTGHIICELVENEMFMTAVFLDRDGVLNRKASEGEYVCTLREFELLPGAVQAVAELSRAGYDVFVVTNQRGIARGLVKAADLDAMHEHLRAAVQQAGGTIKAIYVCPHDYAHECECRKPKPGMLVRAAQEHGVDLRSSWMIGDSASDIKAGKLAGCRTGSIGRDSTQEADICGTSLLDVVRLLIPPGMPTQGG